MSDRYFTRFLLATLLFGSLAADALAQSFVPGTFVPTHRQKPALLQAYDHLPLDFIPNAGQAARQVQFLAHSNRMDLFLTTKEAVFSWTNPTVSSRYTDPAHSAKSPDVVSSVVRMRLQASNPHAIASGMEPLPGKVNYLLGKDPAKWHRNVPTYGKVRYTGVYPGIDLLYYGNQRQLEYDFVVAPHADFKRIALSFAGARRIRIERSGDLLLALNERVLRWRRPVVYQEVNGKRKAVEGRYVLLGRDAVGFAVDKYAANLPLVIDPQLVYATYLGGTGTGYGYAVALDSQGNAYLVGTTSDAEFPVTGGTLQTKRVGSNGNAFVTKFNATGSALLYSTYLGGSGSGGLGDSGNSIAVDVRGDAYVTGYTTSADFPVTKGAFQTTLKGPRNAYVAKLSADGSTLLYSTYLGGTGDDAASGIVADVRGNTYVTGQTSSADFPVTGGAFQTKMKGNKTTAFVTKLSATGSSLLYSTYLGGSGATGSSSYPSGDYGQSIALNASGNAYVVGFTVSADFPVSKSAFQTRLTGNPNTFLAKVNASGSALVYSTYLGGKGRDQGNSIALDSQGNAYIAGQTTSSNFPVSKGAFQTKLKGSWNAFVTRVNGNGSALLYSTYLGGAGSDEGYGIQVDGSDTAFVIGSTNSSDFPVTKNAIQTRLKGNPNTFFTKLSATGSSLVYSTFLGGTGGDFAAGMALDTQGNVYFTGATSSSDFPVTTGAFQTKRHAANFLDAFLVKLQTLRPTTFANLPNLTGTPGEKATLTAQLTDSATRLGISGEKLLFTLSGTPLGTATTGTRGTASLTVTLPAELSIGNAYFIPIFFSGDTNYAPSFGSGMLRLVKGDTAFTAAPNATGKPGAKVTFTVKLIRTGDGMGVANEIVTFKVAGTQIGTARTDTSGTASISYTIPQNTKTGKYTTQAGFAGDTTYNGCTTTGTLTVTP